MHLIGRYEKVRQYGAGGWGLPYILDRKKELLLPFQCDDWFAHLDRNHPHGHINASGNLNSALTYT